MPAVRSMARLISWSTAQARLATPLASCRFAPFPRMPPAATAAAAVGGGRALLLTPLKARFLRARSHHQDNASVEAPSQATAPGSVQKRVALQVCLWFVACVYVFWLFILPYAPGDPVWAIKFDTITMLLDLSINFFFILPLTNWLGIHILESPAVHPTAEALFNVVMGWSMMFAPMLFTDRRRDRYSGSLVTLWGIQMFLTNTVLIPYMAIRLNQGGNAQDVSSDSSLVKLDLTGVRKVMTSGARVVSVICGTVGLISILWFFWGRPDEGFGNLSERWTFFLEYLSSDRVGYAFVWDIWLYSMFQPWLIGDNLLNVDKSKSEVLRYLRFVPYVGLVAYLWGLPSLEDLES